MVRKRPDGYHDIDTIFIPLAIFDRLELEPAPEPGIDLRVDRADVPADATNLVHRAAALTAAALGVEPALQITLEKRIPVGAGLGGGSSDAAATILGVEQLHGRRLEPAQRFEIAAQLGADVPFFLDPMPARGTGRGDRLEPLRGLPPLAWVLVSLPFAVSTPEAYRAASAELTLPRHASSIAALLGPEGVVASPQEDPHNDLEPAVARWHPEISAVRQALRGVGAQITGMSGSGPTVYALFADRSAAERAAERLMEPDKPHRGGGSGGESLPEGACALAALSPGSDNLNWGWGVAKR